MQLQGEQHLPGPRPRVWEILMDPDTIAAIMPGCERLEQVDEGHFHGVIKVKIGPIASRYDASFRVYDTHHPEQYRLRIDGKGRGGSIAGDVHVTLRAQEGGTLMRYEADLAIGGTVARFGQPLVEGVAKMMIAQGFQDLRANVEAKLRAGGSHEVF